MNEQTRIRLTEWLTEHRKAFNDLPWPAPGEDRLGIIENLLRRLVKEGITDEEVLRQLSLRMIEGERTFNLPDHIKQIFIVGHALYREMGRTEGAVSPLDSLDAARLASKDCGTCSGNGLVVFYRQRSHDLSRPVNTITCYCTCPYGRMIRDNHRANAPDVFRRHHDLADHPWLSDPAYSVEPRRIGEDNVSLLDRAGRIANWFRGQPEDFKARWRAEAAAGMPSVANHPLIDDFVAGMIASRHPEFDPGEPEPVAEAPAY